LIRTAKEKAARRGVVNWQPEEDLRFNHVFEDIHGLYKAAVTHRYHQIDRVEVFLAIKASCQVSYRVGGGVEVVTKGASEPEPLAAVFHFQIQPVDNDGINGDVVAKIPEKVGRIILWHWLCYGK